jgi:PPK2 family polyphosphate:nucleotide phosphotransferase
MDQIHGSVGNVALGSPHTMNRLDLHPFRVQPDTKVSLGHWDCEADGGLEKSEGEAQLERNLAALDELQMKFWANRSRALVIVLQGIDSAGKDGVVRKVITALNPQGVIVHSFKKPSDAENAHDYLWRVHSRCPAKGDIAVFNRSHYEDIIVGRVHGTVDAQTIAKRCRHIREFERLLTDGGTIILKFFLTITKDEQLKRLHDRLEDPAKQWKFSMSDMSERQRWPQYIETFELMLSETSTDFAPWMVVPANRKWFRNLVVSETLLQTLTELRMDWPRPTEDLSQIRLR